VSDITVSKESAALIFKVYGTLFLENVYADLAG
jgi:hypothetical protein